MLFLSVHLDPKEDHGFKIDVSAERQEGAIPIDLQWWGEGSSEIAAAIYTNPGSADGFTAIISTVAQAAFNVGKLHQQHQDGVDLVGVR